MPFDNQQFGRRLIQAGVISQAKLDEALQQLQTQPDARLEEILVYLGYVEESTILQFLAAEFRTRYVSTERLARARIPQQVLDLLPVDIAEHHNLIPVLFDPESSTLSIVTADPENELSLREVYTVTRVRELRVYVALQSAVLAAIRKHYRGDVTAFANQPINVNSHHTPLPPTTVFGQESHTDHFGGQDGYMDSFSNNDSNYSVPYGAGGMHAQTPQGAYATPDHHGGGGYYQQNAYGNNTGQVYGDSYQYGYNNNPNDYYNKQQSNYNTGGYYSGHDDYDSGDGDELTQIVSIDQQHLLNPNAGAAEVSPTSTPAEESAGDAASRTSLSMNVLGLAKRLIKRLEVNHPRYRTHISKQEILLRLMFKRLEFSQVEERQIWLAFYLHHQDLPEPHPCLLSLKEDKKLREMTEANLPRSIKDWKLLQLPKLTFEVLKGLYECMDGSGFPAGAKGEEIPKGARILAIVDSFEELTFRNPGISGAEAIKQMRAQGALFDPQMLDTFAEEIQRFERYEKGQISRILLLDADSHLTTKLEELLLERNYWVRVCHSIIEAEQVCRDEEFDLVVLEMEWGDDEDSFSFIDEMKKVQSNPEFIFLTTENADEVMEKALVVARDYLNKPQNHNMIVTKIRKHLREIENEKKRQARKSGLSGSIKEIGLPELLQVLSQGRKTGKLTVQQGDDVGHIYLDQGYVVNALYKEEKGRDAFFKLVVWTDGVFSMNPDETTTEELIQGSLDGLILDALRMHDEQEHEKDMQEKQRLREEKKKAAEAAGGGGGNEYFDLSFDDDGDDDDSSAFIVSPDEKTTGGDDMEGFDDIFDMGDG